MSILFTPGKIGRLEIPNRILRSATAELMAETGVGTRLIRLGLPDCYAHGASRGYLMTEYGLDAAALVAAIEKLLGRPLEIGPADLTAVDLGPRPADANPEAL